MTSLYRLYKYISCFRDNECLYIGRGHNLHKPCKYSALDSEQRDLGRSKSMLQYQVF